MAYQSGKERNQKRGLVVPVDIPPAIRIEIDAGKTKNVEAQEKIINGGRYCFKCGEFLGEVCDPFGRRECANKCFSQNLADAD